MEKTTLSFCALTSLAVVGVEIEGYMSFLKLSHYRKKKKLLTINNVSVVFFVRLRTYV